MTKHIFILLFLALLSFHSNAQNSIDIPPGFYFRISDGANDSYNSETGLLKRYYSDGSQFYKISFNDGEKRLIYEVYKEINFQNFPGGFKIIGNSGDTVFSVTPSFFTSIEVCENDSCNKVFLNLVDLINPINEKDKALQYKRLYDKIWQIIKNKEEYIDIPDSDLFYF